MEDGTFSRVVGSRVINQIFRTISDFRKLHLKALEEMFQRDVTADAGDGNDEAGTRGSGWE